MWETKIKGIPFLQERVSDPVTGKTHIISVKISPDNAKGRKEANRRLLERIDEHKPKPMHVSDLLKPYEKEMEKTLRHSTYRRNLCSLNSMIKIIGDPLIDKLTAGYIRQKLIDSGKEIYTLNELIKRFKTFLMWCYQNDYLPDRSLYDKLKKFPDPGRRDRIENKFLEKEELHVLVDAMGLERWKLLTQFLALSGLRIGEAIALNNDDVTSQYISVTKSYSENYHLISEPKTRSSIREVFVQPELLEVIKKIRVCMMRQRMIFGYEDKGYFFAGADGGRIGYAAYAKYLKETAAKVVPDKQVTPHTLRHTMTSLFAESGASLDVISRRLGHDSSDITRDVYFHITKTRKTMDNAEIETIRIFG